jgi:hypothetical protein
MEDGKIRAGLDTINDEGQDDFFEHEAEAEVETKEGEINIDSI